MRTTIIISLIFVTIAFGKDLSSNFMDNTAFRAISRVYNQCENSDDIFRCLKSKALKLADRALKVQNIKLIDGLSIVKKPYYNNTERSFSEQILNSSDIENISMKSLDSILYDRVTKLMDTHQVQMNIPRLMTVGEEESGRLIEEGRKKMKKFFGPFVAAIMLKAGILKMAYHSIAIVAGKALIIGKIALIISAIIGLKKLVSPESHEKTTYEIVKHPHVQQSHTYSSSSHNDYEGHEGGSSGSYHRSIEDEMLMQDKAYRAYAPKS